MDELYFKYLTVNKTDINYGIFTKVAGFTENPPNAPYPLTQHPSGYHFSWEKGRVLDEYQISYITKGEGVLETRNRTYKIKPGTAFMIIPGQWHRYRPDPETGWDEYYVGFQGTYAAQVFNQPFFRKSGSAFPVGHNIRLLNAFKDIIDMVNEEHPGYQQQLAGFVMNILGEIIAAVRNQEFEGKEIEKRIKEAQFDIRERLDQSLNLEVFAQRYNMSYSYFRKLFKTYTGLSPAQYHLQLRLQKARDLISSTDKSIKEIAFSLGFESQFHFSKIYKKKFGFSPTKTKGGSNII
jgi:AraC-like DNA-binding protein